MQACACAYASFMSVGYMNHEYDLHTGDWMMILISTSDVSV